MKRKYSREKLENFLDLIISHIPNYTDDEIIKDLTHLKDDLLATEPKEDKSKKQPECCDKCFKWGKRYGDYIFPCNNVDCECHVLTTEPKEGKCNCWRQLGNNTSDEKHGDYCASTKEESKPVELPEIEPIKKLMFAIDEHSPKNNTVLYDVWAKQIEIIEKFNQLLDRLNIFTKGR